MGLLDFLGFSPRSATDSPVDRPATPPAGGAAETLGASAQVEYSAPWPGDEGGRDVRWRFTLVAVATPAGLRWRPVQLEWHVDYEGYSVAWPDAQILRDPPPVAASVACAYGLPVEVR